MNDKAQAMIDELVAACIAFGRQVEPDWQTRIEAAQRELREYIDELEGEIDMLKQLSQPIEFWSDEKIQIYKSNESRTIKSGYEEREE